MIVMVKIWSCSFDGHAVVMETVTAIMTMVVRVRVTRVSFVL